MKFAPILAAAVLSLATTARADDVKTVIVGNTAAQPVPVNIKNVPSVTVASLPPVTLAGPVAISGPIVVQTAALAPFTASTHLSITPTGTNATGVGVFNVPPGKRAVIETVSIAGNMSAATSQASIGTSTSSVIGGGNGSFSLPLTSDGFGSETTVALKLYADGNSQIYCEVVTSAIESHDANCNVAGYLVDQQ